MYDLADGPPNPHRRPLADEWGEPVWWEVMHNLTDGAWLEVLS